MNLYYRVEPNNYLMTNIKVGLSETLLILGRYQKGLDHLSGHEVPVEIVEFVQPKLVPIKISIGSIIRIAPQIAEVLHQHEG